MRLILNLKKTTLLCCFVDGNEAVLAQTLGVVLLNVTDGRSGDDLDNDPARVELLLLNRCL